jgi:hypothetical protein
MEMNSATRVASAHMRKEAASGLFGFTKSIQREGESAIKRVKKQAEKISTQLEKRHPEAGVYLTLRCTKAGCVPSKALAKVCIFNRPQTRVLKGPMGFKPSTAKASQKAISDILLFAGEVGYTLYHKKNDVLPFLTSYAKRKRCPYAKLLTEAYPHIQSGL